MTTIPVTDTGRRGPDRILLGLNQHHHPILWHRNHPTSPHLQISGSTGGGKGGALKPILTHCFKVGDIVPIVSPKGTGEFGWTEGAAAALVDTLEGSARVLAWARQQMERRQAIRRTTPNPRTGTTGVAHIDQTGQHHPAITVILDEFAAIGGEEAATEKDDKPVVDRILADTARIAKQGRSDKVHLVIVTQRPTIEGTFATGGGAIQANLKARLHFDRDADSLKAFAKGTARIGPAALRDLNTATGAGRCLYVHLNPADGGTVHAGQIWWLEDEQCRPFAERYTGPPPMTFDPEPVATERFTPHG